MINTDCHTELLYSISGVRLFVSLQVYDHQYKAVLDGVETESVMEIDPGQRIEIFRMGNGSEEVLEVHDFKHVSKRLNKATYSYFHTANNLYSTAFFFLLFFVSLSETNLCDIQETKPKKFYLVRWTHKSEDVYWVEAAGVHRFFTGVKVQKT